MTRLSGEFLSTLGEMSVEFVYLERVLHSAISDVTSIETNLMDRLIATDSFEVLISKFNNIIIYKLHEYVTNKKQLEELKKELKLLCKDIRDVGEQRNLLIHSLWFKNSDGITIRQRFNRNIKEIPSFNEKEKFELQTELKSLKDFIVKINKTINTVSSFTDKIIKLLSPQIEVNNAKG